MSEATMTSGLRLRASAPSAPLREPFGGKAKPVPQVNSSSEI
eukprot:CAMPEP_0118990872 /NCGR_PEP_ID=MMETSP1173-20130426/50730_1 /TAXON_ID=1034831 /ORGANISM="Rhizochromulina marina cf, Strain CCMP1243" /LENGTH=41 /DNA_ID= /DNA_START= /DNA_END= /DNA_ORIENTATION=